MKKVYIAGKLWNDNDKAILEKVDKLVQSLGFKTYLPHRDMGLFEEWMNSSEFFKRDRDEIDDCSVMVAVLDWKGIGSGTAWEIGYAHAKNIPVIGLIEDWSSINKDERVCVMCLNSVILVESLDNLNKKLKKLIN